MPTISVILPIYGVEAYLDRCIQSLVHQDFSDFELILVDDGSPDRCGTICDDWAKKDERITVYHKENGGVSDARNFGIERAKGEYLSFVDSDDYVTPDYLSYLYSLIQKEDRALISACNHIVKRANSEKINSSVQGVRVLDRKEAFSEVLYHGMVDVSPWGKLYRRCVFSTLRFPKGKRYEDTYLFPDLLMETDFFVYGGEPKYYYVQHENSFVDGSWNETRAQFLDAVDHLCTVALRFDSSLADACLRREIHACLSVLRYMENCGEKEYAFRDSLRSRVLKNAKAVLSDPRVPRRDRLAIQALKMGFSAFFFAWRIYGIIR